MKHKTAYRLPEKKELENEVEEAEIKQKIS